MASLKDVASKAGVNISTASRALNGNSHISSKTIERVRQVAQELNYTPNVNARILAGKSSRMIGIIVPETNSDYFSKMINKLEPSLQKHDYSLLIANTQYQADKEQQILENFINYNIDGIFLACTINASYLSYYQKYLSTNKVPMIALDARQSGAECSQISVDDVSGISAAIEHLLSRGHKRIGFLGDYILNKTLRTNMFLEALKRCGLDPNENPVYSHPRERFEKAGYEDMKHFLALENHPDAYIAGYDDIAIGAMRAVKEAGLEIPKDIAIIGNDNGRAGDYLYNRLTTLSPPVERIAEIGVDLMLGFIESKDLSIIHSISLKPELLIRETT